MKTTIAAAIVILTAASANADIILPDLPGGSQYQIVFITAETTLTTSGNIENYNAFVTSAANSNPALAALGVQWRAVASTVDVAANINAPSSGSVYNAIGQELASLAQGLYSGGGLLAPINYNQHGHSLGSGQMATGSDVFGDKIFFNLTNDGGPLGHLTYVQLGDRTAWGSGSWLQTGSKGSHQAISGRHLYALSSPITVVPEPTTYTLALAALFLVVGRRRSR